MAKGLCPCGAKARRWQGYCNACHAAATREYRATHIQSDEQRLKANCRSYLHVYIKRGKVKKGPCVFCGTTENIEAHHEDYSKPLQVIWMCRGHRVMYTIGIIELPSLPCQ